MTGADVFVLFGIPAAVLVFGAALYWHADLSARRSEVRIVELRQQETESVELGAPTREEKEYEWLQAREAFQEQIARREAGQGEATQPATLTRAPARGSCRRPGVVANPHGLILRTWGWVLIWVT
jgi:Flp pilus assembly protein TadB